MKAVLCAWLATALLAITVAGCRGPQAPSRGPYQAADAGARDTVRAQALSRDAAELVIEDPSRAESLLRDALAADLFYGPAHNNLGVVFLGRGELYEAASEFEWARKLMPGHADPRVNLGLVLEAAGKLGESREAYESALEASPGHVAAIQGLARALVRDGRNDPRLVGWLETISLEGETEAWRAWARGRLAVDR